MSESEATSARNNEKITPFQIASLSCCLLLNMQDGFDILSIAYSANAIAVDWQLSQIQLGAILSASMFGILLGSLFLSPYADKFGRKNLTLIGLLISGIGMTGAAVADNPDMLMISRAITGIGVGGIIASLNTLVSEYASDRFRSMAVAIFQMGFPLGAVVGGFIAGWLLDIGNWRHVFAFGALLSFIFIPVVMMLPESIDYLAKSGQPNALGEINKIRSKLGKEPINDLPPIKNKPPKTIDRILQLFSKKYWLRTILVWLAFFFLLMSLYFVLSWVPKLLIEQGLSQSQGIKGGMLLNLLGVVGIISFALMSTRVHAATLGFFYLIGTGFFFFYLGTVSQVNSSTLITTAIIGFFVHASMIALYATVPMLYPSEIRATATGWAIGLSRFGAMLGPWLTGLLLAQGWLPQDIYPVFAAPSFLAAFFIGILAFKLRR